MNAIPSPTLAVSAYEKAMAASSSMASGHTRAGLVARTWTSHAATTIGVQHDIGFEPIADVSGFGRDPERDAADARRLAACWNACMGIPLEVLEARGFRLAEVAP